MTLPTTFSAIEKMETASVPVAQVLGCRIHRVTMEQALKLSRGFLADGKPHMIVTADASMIEMANRDEVLMDIINAADLVVPDSVGIVWACSRMHKPVPERVTGVDLMERLCELGARENLTAYFLGAEPGVAEQAAKNLEARFPGFRVVGTHHGFLKPGDTEKIEQAILELKPHFLFVALGIPKQEKWIRERMQRLNVPISVGVGGSFDCHSGRTPRAPEIFQRYRIEWLYRLLMNPRKYKKALLLPRFAWRVLRSR